jgi:hypothetical protein
MDEGGKTQDNFKGPRSMNDNEEKKEEKNDERGSVGLC